MLVGSMAGQLLMVLQKTETWPVWIAVNVVGTVLYASQGLYFTSLFYAVLILMAVTGWRAWSARAESRPRHRRWRPVPESRRAGLISVVGGESTGKSTLAATLGERLPAVVVEEFLRTWVHQHRTGPRPGRAGRP